MTLQEELVAARNKPFDQLTWHELRILGDDFARRLREGNQKCACGHYQSMHPETKYYGHCILCRCEKFAPAVLSVADVKPATQNPLLRVTRGD